MTRRLRIVLASAIVLVGLGLIVILSIIGVTHTGFGQERARGMVSTMLAGQVKGRVYIGRMSGGFFNGVTIDSLGIRDDEDSVFFASGPVRASYDHGICSIAEFCSATCKLNIQSFTFASTRTATG